MVDTEPFDPSENEQHKRRFTGYWIPSYVVEMFDNDQINAKEMILLATVDSFARGDQGCFASNQFLATKIKVKSAQISVMLSHLLELGLLVKTGFDGRHRYLKTCWTAQNREADSRPAQNHKSDLWKTISQTYGKPIGRPMENRAHISIGISKEEEDTSQFVNCESNSEDLSFRPNGFLTKEPTKTTPINFDVKAATLLNEALVKELGQCNNKTNLAAWAKEFRLLRTKDGVAKESIKEMLLWYIAHLKEPYSVEAYSGRSFREKYMSGKLLAFRRRVEQSSNGDRAEGPEDGYDERGRPLTYICSGVVLKQTEPGLKEHFERERAELGVDGDSIWEQRINPRRFNIVRRELGLSEFDEPQTSGTWTDEELDEQQDDV